MCIEAKHYFTNFEKVLEQSAELLSDKKEACFVLADFCAPGKAECEK